jgi:Protein of unknown function (DUF2971)
MVTKAILLNTGDFTDRPKDPAPIAVLLQEMKEYCKRNNYTVVAEINSQQKFIFERNTPLARLIHESSTATDDVVIVRLGRIYEQVEGDTIDPDLTRLVSENRIRIEPIEHPCVSPPSDGNTSIWRYLSLPKFVDLLQSSSLHFTRVDEMRKFDPSEGVSSTLAMKRFVQRVAEHKIEPPISGMTHEQFAKFYGSTEVDDALVKMHFINCWHMSDHENFAMWKVYSETYGVCIESQFDDLKNSFVDQKWDYFSNKYKIYIGKVEYIDSETQFIRRDNSFWTYLSKRREYSYENELRCVLTESNQPNFVRPKVDLKRLIRKIRLNPEAPTWYHATIVDLCLKYGFNPSKIAPSALSEN